ncbi:MAG: CrcB family protein [Planctomycetes bacterium]|nr:CrcB family protein [Planctomycetota bacterium]
MARVLILLFVAGGLGTLVRFGVIRAFATPAPAVFPWGTVAVNCAGSLLCGLVYGLATALDWAPEWRTTILVGFLGALTTFSTLTLESVLLAQGDRLVAAFANLIVSVAAGLVCLWAGLTFARAFVGGD